MDRGLDFTPTWASLYSMVFMGIEVWAIGFVHWPGLGTRAATDGARSSGNIEGWADDRRSRVGWWLIPDVSDVPCRTILLGTRNEVRVVLRVGCSLWVGRCGVRRVGNRVTPVIGWFYSCSYAGVSL